MSIRWKIAILCIGLSLLPIVFLNTYTVSVFDEFTRRMQEEQMIDYAYVIAEDYRRQVESGHGDADFPQRLSGYQRRFNARLRVVTPDGLVRYDSESGNPGEAIWNGEEVRKALQGHYGARTALDPDRTLLYYHIALPIRTADNAIIGAACASAHTQAITRAIQGIIRDYRLTMAMALGVSMLAAVLLSYTMTRRLRSLTRAVGRFASRESLLDVSAQGRDEIGELARACKQLAVEIKQASDSQYELLAKTTHQLKTPLTAIRSSVQIIMEAQEPDRLRFLNNIEISTARLLVMVEQLAALSRLNAEDLRGRKMRIAFVPFIREVVERLYPRPATPILIEAPEQDIPVLIMPERIEQVVSNLMDNALRHTPATGLITIQIKRTGSDLVCAIADTGTGIEASDLPKIFDQFFSTVKGSRLTDNGNGLGLPIARAIILHHNGQIHVESTPGKGSIFTFSLPILA